jgi:hypothetical protein
VVAERTGAQAGPATMRLAAVLNHATRPLRDSANAVLGGVTLPTIPLAPLGVRLDMGQGSTQLVVRRNGENLFGQWRVRSTQPKWERMDTTQSAAGGSVADQAKAAAVNLVWETLSGLREVEIEAAISGTLSSPSLSVRSNVGNALAESLKRQLGAQLERAERLVRAKVDSIIQRPIAQAQARLQVIRSEVEGRVAAQRAELEQVKRELEERIRGLAPRLPGGIRLPI